MGGHAIHKVTVMGDHDQLVFPVSEELAQPADGKNIEIVGGFIEQKKVRFAQQHLCQSQPHLESARKIRGMAVKIFLCKAEALKNSLYPI